MSVADKDGRMLQAAQDQLACLRMELAEYIIDLKVDVLRYSPPEGFEAEEWWRR